MRANLNLKTYFNSANLLPLCIATWLCLLPFVFLFSQNGIPLSCSETIDAGDDLDLCHPGGVVVLDGFFSDPTPLILEWTPAAGLSDPFVINPTATVSQTTTYTLTIKNPKPVNLLSNGDFEAGNTGFYSEYTHNLNPLLGIPQYAITTNPAPHYPPEYAWCGDHTSGSGYMMVVNGNTVPEPDVWCQTISISPNTDYYFECFMTSVYPTAPANLQIRFNGNAMTTVQLPSDTCEWIPYWTIWNSGAASSLTICIVDINLIGWGNDFALDDLFFSELCTYTDQVTVNVYPEAISTQDHVICSGEIVEVGGQIFDQSGNYEINLFAASGCDSTVYLSLEVIDVLAVIQSPLALTCDRDTIVLNGSGSFGAFGISAYHWTTSNGLILSNPDSSSILAGSTGIYNLQVTTTNGSITCSQNTNVQIQVDTLVPIISIDTPAVADCNMPQQTLTGHLDSIFPGQMVLWTTPNGMIINNADSLAVVISGAGLYTLSVTNGLNGCSSTQSVQVLADTSQPQISILPVAQLNCKDTTLQIVATVSGSPSGFYSQWSTVGGEIIQGSNTLTPLIGMPGVYQITVTDSLTGCLSIAQIMVNEDIQLPTIQFAVADTLTCIDTIIVLNASGSTSGHHTISWSGPPGSLIQNALSLMPSVNTSGWYSFTVMDSINYCQAKDSIFVEAELTEPIILFSIPDTLDCSTSAILIDASGVQTKGVALFEWSTVSGNILSGMGTPILSVNKSGFYTLLLTDGSNGCTAVDSIYVFQDTDLPQVTIVVPDSITCDKPVVTILSTWQSPHPTVSFSWTTQNGNILSGQNSANPVVNLPGIYVLAFTDETSGCVIMAQVEVISNQIKPDLTILNTPIITCLDSIVFIETTFSPSYNYLWTTSNGNISGLNTLSTLKATSAGTYFLSVIDNTNGCKDSLSLVVMEDRVAPKAIAGKDTLIPCGLMDFLLDGSPSSGNGPLNFSWSSFNGHILADASTATPKVVVPGTYELLVTDVNNGCTARDTIQIEQMVDWDVAFDIVPPGCLPAGKVSFNITGNANPPYQMMISGLPDLIPQNDTYMLAPGTWSVRISDASGCVLDTQITMAPSIPLELSLPAELILSGGPGTIEIQTNVSLDQIQSITWSPPTWLTPTSNALIWLTNPPDAVKYDVQLMTKDSCLAFGSIQILIDDRSFFYVPNAFSPSDINGINDHFFPYHSSGSGIMISEMAVYDRWGNQVFRQGDFLSNEAQFGWDGTFRGKPLDPGVYIWVIEIPTLTGTRLYKGEVTLF